MLIVVVDDQIEGIINKNGGRMTENELYPLLDITMF